ncbi:carbon monoxide dehydrogenase subunit G [Halobacteria archaeon AArc-dxtr1]|nr:carbon monoxide dehydrogenase subunit G [Halobacteria archaeon AArc-dxtr1]
MLEFTGENEMAQPADELWNYFTDTDVLADCAPGCKEMSLESPHEIDAVMAVGVGSVKPEFDVDVVVTRTDRPHHLEMTAVGHAPRNEFETTAEMHLEETDDGGTKVVWSATADVSGTIASLGGRALKSVTNRLVKKFFSCMEGKVEEGVEAESELEAAPEEDADLDVEAESADADAEASD